MEGRFEEPGDSPETVLSEHGKRRQTMAVRVASRAMLLACDTCAQEFKVWPRVAGGDRSQPDHVVSLLGLEDTQEGQAMMPPLGKDTEQQCPADFQTSPCLQPPSLS